MNAVSVVVVVANEQTLQNADLATQNTVITA